MADIAIEEATKVYPTARRRFADLDLAIADGEFVVSSAPSGCGKTTALRMVAGLEEISSGTVRIGGRVVNDLLPKDRDVAMVFQNYALYPHMSVHDQHGLRLGSSEDGQGRDRAARERCRGNPRSWRSTCSVVAEGAVGRTAPAGGDGPDDRAGAASVS